MSQAPNVAPAASPASPGGFLSSKRARALMSAALPIVIAIAGILVVLNIISYAFGQAPADTLRRAFEGTWGTPYGIGQVLFKASPLLMTGLAFQVALRAGLFNIGTEGQLALAGLAGACAAQALPKGTPALIALTVAIGTAMLAGAGAALVPALLRARLGVHEIISFIMMNRVSDILVPWFLVAVLGATALRTADVAPGAVLPRLDVVFPQLRGSAASAAFPLAVVVVFGVDALLKRTKAGREMRWVGLGPETAQAEGVAVPRRIVLAILLSGALAGAAMSSTVLGYKGYFELGLGVGAGWTGIAVALLGRGHPLGIVLAAVLFGTLDQAGLAINAVVPKDAMAVLQAVIIILLSIANSAARSSILPSVPDPPRASQPPKPESSDPSRADEPEVV